MSKKSKHYYSIEDDLDDYPEAWGHIVVGGRNTGKTYSSLLYLYKNKKRFVFLKRTIEDVKLLCAGNGRIGTKKLEYGIDLSPFKSINRDVGCNVRAFSIDNGIGAFWECDSEGEPVGDPVGYLLALSAVSKFKGFDLSDCSFIVFDEFIPQPWERINRKEGEQLMDLYKTVSRDRVHRSSVPLKLLCLANATNVYNPTCEVMELTDIIANMSVFNQEHYYSEERGLHIHMLHNSEEFDEVERSDKFYKAMADTQWGQMAYDNKFGYNDFTAVNRVNLKGFQPQVEVKYKKNFFYIYYHDDGRVYMTTSRSNKCPFSYDLNIENDQKSFFLTWVIDLRNACIEGRMEFKTFTMYNLIVNYKQYFRV